MPDNAQSKLNFFLPSILDVFIIIILFYVVFMDAGGHLLRDADTGFHIMTGKYILENLALPTKDIFSYTVPGQDWVAFSWGTGFIFAILEKYTGLNGVVIFSILLIISTLVIVYSLLIKWKVRFSVLLISMSALVCMSTIHWLARPHLFTIFFTALTFFYLN